MIFYQTTTDSVSAEQIKEALFHGCRNPQLHYFNFLDFPEIHSFEEAYSVIEAKRQTIQNPDNHSFLCLTLDYDSTKDLSAIISSVNTIANTFNSHYNNDLFLMSLVYQDPNNHLHSCVIISDIERSLNASSDVHVSYENIKEILKDALPECSSPFITYNALYLFAAKEHALAYDGVIHVLCQSQPLSIPDRIISST